VFRKEVYLEIQRDRASELDPEAVNKALESLKSSDGEATG